MTRKETLEGIASLANEKEICGLIEVQQELSEICLHFTQAIENYYGECPNTDTAARAFYDKCVALNRMVNEWLGTMLHAHFSKNE